MSTMAGKLAVALARFAKTEPASMSSGRIPRSIGLPMKFTRLPVDRRDRTSIVPPSHFLEHEWRRVPVSTRR